MLILAGPLLVQQRREREEADQRRRAEEHRRYQEAEQKRLDDNRWRHFVEVSERWRQADNAHRFLAALEQQNWKAIEAVPGSRSISDWITWARDRVARFDPLTGGAADVFRQVSEVASWTYRD